MYFGLGLDSPDHDSIWGCVIVKTAKSYDLEKLCEEVYEAYVDLLKRGVSHIRILIDASRASDWVPATSCVLTRNLIATVEVYSGKLGDDLLKECVDVLAVPVAPPTS